MNFITDIGPQIKQYYDRNLLTNHEWADPKMIEERYLPIALKKFRNQPKQLAEFYEILNIYKECYEWFKTEDSLTLKESQAKKKKPNFSNTRYFRGKVVFSEILKSVFGTR